VSKAVFAIAWMQYCAVVVALACASGLRGSDQCVVQGSVSCSCSVPTLLRFGVFTLVGQAVQLLQSRV